MPRPTPAQLGYGTFAVVAAVVVLLAATGAESMLAVTLLVILGLIIGTIAAALAVTAPKRRPHSQVVARSPRATRPAQSAPAREPVNH